MTNGKIAKLVAEKIYPPALNETDFAFQLFVERLAIPKGVKSYHLEEVEAYILSALEDSE